MARPPRTIPIGPGGQTRFGAAGFAAPMPRSAPRARGLERSRGAGPATAVGRPDLSQTRRSRTASERRPAARSPRRTDLAVSPRRCRPARWRPARATRAPVRGQARLAEAHLREQHRGASLPVRRVRLPSTGHLTAGQHRLERAVRVKGHRPTGMRPARDRPPADQPRWIRRSVHGVDVSRQGRPRLRRRRFGCLTTARHGRDQPSCKEHNSGPARTEATATTADRTVRPLHHRTLHSTTPLRPSATCARPDPRCQTARAGRRFPPDHHRSADGA